MTTSSGATIYEVRHNLTTHFCKVGSGRMIPYEKWVEPEGTSRPASLPGHAPPTEPKARKTANSTEQPQGGSSERKELQEAKEPAWARPRGAEGGEARKPAGRDARCLVQAQLQAHLRAVQMGHQRRVPTVRATSARRKQPEARALALNARVGPEHSASVAPRDGHRGNGTKGQQTRLHPLDEVRSNVQGALPSSLEEQHKPNGRAASPSARLRGEGEGEAGARVQESSI